MLMTPPAPENQHVRLNETEGENAAHPDENAPDSDKPAEGENTADSDEPEGRKVCIVLLPDICVCLSVYVIARISIYLLHIYITGIYSAQKVQ